MQNLKVWISIASSTGLSVTSLGTPGLKEDLDEQVFTGGISAVTQLLSTEIGSSEKSFLGGGDTRKMGRFVVQGKNAKEAVTQFLLMSNDDSKVPDSILNYIKEISIQFAQLIVSSPIWNEVEKQYKTLSSLDVLDIFIEAITTTRKSISSKIQMNDELFVNQTQLFVNHTFKSPEFFETLNSISEMEPSIEDVQTELKSKKEEIMKELANEIISVMLDDDPIPILFKSKLANNTLNNDIRIHFNKYVAENIDKITKNELSDVTNEIFSNDIAEILQNFNVVELRESKQKIHSALTNEVIIRISKKNPLLLLVNPSLNSKELKSSFKVYIDENVEAIYQEYDLASILGKISSQLLEGEDPISIFLISEFIRMFAMHFPSGLSNHGWKFIHTTFNMFSKMKKTDIKQTLNDLDISPSHLSTINSFLKSIKPSNDLKSMRFTISKEGEEIIKFYNILQQVIVEGTQNFFNEIIWAPKQLGIFSQNYTEKIERVLSQTQYLSSLVAILKFISTDNSLEYISTFGFFPTLNDLIEAGLKNEFESIDVKNISESQRRELWKPRLIVKSYETHSKQLLDTSIDDFNRYTTKIKQSLESHLKAIKEVKKDPKKGKKSKNVLKSIERDKFESFNTLDNYSVDIWKSYSEIVKICEELSNNNSDPKKSDKLLDNIIKHNERLQKKIIDHTKRVKEYHQKYLKNIEKESQKLLKDCQKVFSNSIISEYQIREHKNKEKFIIPNPKSVCNMIISSIENNQTADAIFPKNSELISTFASIVIFNNLPRNIFNDVLNTAILMGGKGSPIINEMISEMKLKSSPSVDYLFIEDHLKKNIRNHTEKRFINIFNSIISKINQAYFNGVIRSYLLVNDEFGEISSIDIGEFNIPWIIELINNKETDLFGEYTHFVEVDNKFHVFYEIERFPSSGQRYPITKAITQATWNQIIADQAGLYIEFLKMCCELVGESRRKRFQEFLEKLFQVLD